MPSRFDEYRESWVRHHPDWDIRLWTDDDIPPLVNQDIYDRAARYVPEPNIGQLKADIVRYELLWQHGGVFLDIDFEALKPIDPLLNDVECFAAWEIQDEWIANGFMGATVHHPFIGRLIEQLPASMDANRGKTPNFSSGPRWFTAMHRRYNEMTVFPTRLVYPYTYDDMIARSGREHPPWPEECYMVHHWNDFRRILAERQRRRLAAR